MRLCAYMNLCVSQIKRSAATPPRQTCAYGPARKSCIPNMPIRTYVFTPITRCAKRTKNNSDDSLVKPHTSMPELAAQQEQACEKTSGKRKTASIERYCLPPFHFKLLRLFLNHPFTAHHLLAIHYFQQIHTRR